MKRLSPHLLLDLVPWLLAAALLYALGDTWLARMGHPYDLEWMEGGMLVHAWRVQQGLPLYPEPGPDFIPYIYPPGYAWTLAMLGKVFGLSHGTGRALSLFGTLAAAAAIPFMTWRHGAGKNASSSARYGALSAGALAAVCFLGTYPDSGAFHDLVRIDGLFIGLMAWSVALALERAAGAHIAAGLLLALAFLVKHNAALLGVPLSLGLWATHGWRAGLRFGLAAAVPAGLATLGLQISTEGRFLAYLLDVPGTHNFVFTRFFPGTGRELTTALPVAMGTAGAYVWWRARTVALPRAAWMAVPWGAAAVAGLYTSGLAQVRGIPKSDAWVDYLGFGGIGLAAGALALVLVDAIRTKRVSGHFALGVGVVGFTYVSAMLMRGHHGGFLNVHIQAHWVIALAFGVAIARLRADGKLTTAILGTALLTSQLYDHQDFAEGRARLQPTAEDLEVGDALVAKLAALDIEGPVLSPFAPWLAVQAGYEPAFPLIALWDVDHEGTPFPDAKDAVTAAVRSGHYGAVIETRNGSRLGAEKVYGRMVEVPGGNALSTKTGWRVRPSAILLPSPALPAFDGDLPNLPKAGRPLQLSALLSEAGGTQQWRVLDVTEQGLHWNGEPAPDDLAAHIRATGDGPVLLRAPGDTRALRLQAAQVAMGRAQTERLWVALKPRRGKPFRAELPPVPVAPEDGERAIRIVISGTFAQVSGLAVEVEPVVVAIPDLMGLYTELGKPTTMPLLAVSTEATLFEVLQQITTLKRLQPLRALTWDTTWPEDVPQQASDEAALAAFIAAMEPAE